jgi:molybdopterin-guanine dinucleotide biosynthesis protein A
LVTGEKTGGLAASVGGYVLAGGASSRFGTDKALAQLGGETMLARMCGLLSEVTGGVNVVASVTSYSGVDAQMVADRWPGEGPLGGIVTALEDARESERRALRCLIVSCDMPFLTAEWLQYLCAHAASSAAQIVVPRSAQGLEPLCACWSTDAAETLHGLFEAGVRKVTEVFEHSKTEILDEAHWKRFDSAGRLFWNMNTPQDYQEALKVFAEERR